MNLKSRIDDIMKSAVRLMVEREGWTLNQESAFALDPPGDPSHGDLSTTLAMALAKQLRQPPMKIAQAFIAALESMEVQEGRFYGSAQIAPPGFINFTLSQAWLERGLREAFQNPERYGWSDALASEKILVEFVSANPTGPLHVGHARGAIAGDAIASLYQSQGANVTREYYYNDGGLQMETLGASTQARYLEILGKPFEFPENGYRGDYIRDIAQKMIDAHGDTLVDSDAMPFTEFAANDILKTIDKDMKDLRISFDTWTNESDFFKQGKVTEVVQRLKDLGAAYEQDGAIWLRSSVHGDQRDRVLVRSTGVPTYITPDIAYHVHKFERGYTRVINVMGGDHHGHVPGLKAALKELGYDVDHLIFVLIQMVSLQKGQERIKLSTRAGDFLPLYEMISEIGSDVTRYFFLMRSVESMMTFDWDLAKTTSMENPVYYIQYLHARVCSLARKAEEAGFPWPLDPNTDLSPLTLPEERALMRAVFLYPSVTLSAAQTMEPHRLTVFLEELAKSFHNYYTYHRVVDVENRDLTIARLFLLESVRCVIANALGLLGVSAPRQM